MHQKRSFQASLSGQINPDTSFNHLRIASINVKQCKKRLTRVVEASRGGESPWDIIFLQDPDPDIRNWHTGSAEYALHFTDGKKIAFLVRKKLPPSSWSIQDFEDTAFDRAQTLLLTTCDALIAFHNVYNHDFKGNGDDEDNLDTEDDDVDKVNFELLLDEVERRYPVSVFVGDFNAHHPSWGGVGVKHNPAGTQLHDAMQIHELQLFSPVGSFTYSRGRASKRQRTLDMSRGYCSLGQAQTHPDNSSTIDLIFGSQDIADHVLSCEVNYEIFDSDHRVLEATFNSYAYRLPPRTRFLVSRLGQAQDSLVKSLERLGLPELDTDSSISSYAETLVGLIDANCKTFSVNCNDVPTPLNPYESSPTVRSLKIQADQALRKSEEASDSAERQRWDSAAKSLNQLIGVRVSMERTKQWRNYVTEQGKQPSSMYCLLRKAKAWSKPRNLAHMPPLQFGDRIYHTDEEKADCMKQALYLGHTSTERVEPIERPLEPSNPLPIDSQDQSDVAYQGVKHDEVSRRIQATKAGKAPGMDEVSIDHLKRMERIVVPPLEHLFQACLKRSFYPDAFKAARIILIQKPDKMPQTPNAWRPIALLSVVGKILEGILAARLRDINEKFHLMPVTQFAAPHKSTSHALRHMQNLVYHAWCKDKPRCRRRTTIVSYDMKGAYDRILHNKLLEVLTGMGLPYWFTMFIWSFLHGRLAILEMPGHKPTEKFFLNIGILQGSPISTGLFIAYAAPMLKLFPQCTFLAADYPTSDDSPDDEDSDYEQVTGATGWAFADDTEFQIQSESWEENCRIIERMHKEILKWADENGITFNAAKYEVMHFQQPSASLPQCTLVPAIPGMKLVHEMKILGVTVDERLNWNKHVEDIVKKVEAKLQALWRFWGTPWGFSIEQARSVYCSTIRPIITYGAGAWFLEPKAASWCFKKGHINTLERLEYRCLMKITKAMKSTAYEFLLKELHLHSISNHLQCLAETFRAKASATDPIIPEGLHVPKELLEKHPLHKLHVKDAELLSKAKARQRKASGADSAVNGDLLEDIAPQIKKIAHERAEAVAAKRWDLFRCDPERAGRSFRPPAMEEAWGKKSFGYYKDLTRSQGTLLLRFRTGADGLQAHLYSMNQANKILADTPRCPLCNYREHRAEHLLVFCPKLNEARIALRHMASGIDFAKLMTRDAKYAMQWAIWVLDLPHFRWAKGNEPNEFEPVIRESAI